MSRDKLRELQWRSSTKPVTSNQVSSPSPREGGDGDMQIRNSSIGTKLWAKTGGKWLSNMLYGPNDNITLETKKNINLFIASKENMLTKNLPIYFL